MGAVAESEVPASRHDVRLETAGCRRVAFAGRVSGSVGSGASGSEPCGAAGVRDGDVADFRSSGATVVPFEDVWVRRAPPVLDTFPVLAERNSGADDSDADGARADPGLEADGPDTAAAWEPVAPCGDEAFPAEEFNEESDDESGPESVGLAEASPADAARPTPTPKATTSAPTPLLYLASPIIASPIHDDEAKATPSVLAAKGKENYRLESALLAG